MRAASQLDMTDVGRLLPMHLALDDDGQISGCGPTLRKLIGPVRSFSDAFALYRPQPGCDGALPALQRAAQAGKRVFLRLTAQPQTILRGHGTVSQSGHLLLDLGFGIGLTDAVRRFSLTDADFSPADLVMEMLFLHEANTAVLSALSDYNLHLDDERRQAESRAYADSLTGLVNRRGLNAALEAAMRGVRSGGGPAAGRRAEDCDGFAILQLDLDGFKGVNDSFGHAVGDGVLQHVAGVLRAETRTRDSVARPGGDEFVLILPGLLDPAALQSLSQRIIKRIEDPIAVDGGTVRISASIGIAVSSDYRPDRLDRIMADADAALYIAKRSGRGRSCHAPTGGPGDSLAAAAADPSADDGGAVHRLPYP